ncbi:hypothetical protein FOCC_FOCC001943 [Frankliniella occidentalis]|nr:hypothetical protein FOCC_FOCC001943 [Frankliniella occidentalis]
MLWAAVAALATLLAVTAQTPAEADQNQARGVDWSGQGSDRVRGDEDQGGSQQAWHADKRITRGREAYRGQFPHQPVRLPTTEEARDKHHGLWGKISGWGATRTDGYQNPKLKWARLPVSQPGKCRFLDGPSAHTQFCTDVYDYKGKGTQGHGTCSVR